MLKITIGFFLGIALFLQLGDLPDYPFLLFPFFCLIFTRSRTLNLIAFIAIGFLWTWFRAELILSNDLHRELEGELIEVTGKVASLPERTQFGQRFKFKIEEPISFNNQTYQLPKLIQLTWNQFENNLEPGQTLNCYIKLKRPYGFFNLGTFDYEFYLFHQAIRATGYVVAKKSCQVLSKDNDFSIDYLRYKLKNSFLNKFSQGNELKNLIVALMIGDKSLITAEQWKVLQQTGTSHLLAISGLHIGLVFTFGYFVANYLFRLLPFLIVRVPAQRIALLAGLVFAIFYSALAGFALPTQRALIMLCLSVLSIWNYNSISIRRLFSTSLLFIFLLDPFAINTPSFWLSFTAVGFIIYGMSYRVKPEGIWWAWGRAQWLIMIGLMPMALFWFQMISEFSFVANIIAIPIVSFCVVPLILIYAIVDLVQPELSGYILSLIDISMSLLWSFLEFIYSFPKFELSVSSPSLITTIISLIAVLWFLLPGGFPAKTLAFLLLSPLFFSTVDKPKNNDVWLHILDVGQGTAVIVQTANQTMLYDTGAKFSDRFNAGSAVVVPVLQTLGVSKVDKLIISHADNDHIGGLASVLEGIQVDEVLFNGKFNQKEQKLWKHSDCTYRQSWKKDGIDFTILHPKNITGLGSLSKNQSSCVVQINTDSLKILLPGDIDYKIELKLLEQYSNTLQSDILLVPHHGSKTSSSEPFIDVIKPKYALITNGYRNRFGFPKQVIMSRYQKRGVQAISTVDSGMLSFKLTNNELNISQYRAEHRRFWHTIP